MARVVHDPRRRRAARGGQGARRSCGRSRRRYAIASCSTTATSRSSRSAPSCSTVTGAEALYADMGHFGRAPIRRAWFAAVFPALVLNYMGQGALMLHTPSAIENPFFLLFPDWSRIPMVAARHGRDRDRLAGGHLRRLLGHPPGGPARLPPAPDDPPHLARGGPGLRARPSTGASSPRSSCSWSGSAPRRTSPSAYGIAVTGTLAIDTVLFFVVVRVLWKKPLWVVDRRRGGFFLLVDLTFFAANLPKVAPRRLVPARDRRHRVRRADDVAARPRDRDRASGGAGGAAAATSSRRSATPSSRSRARRARASSSTPTRRRRRSRCAPTSSTTACCTRTS